MMANPTMPDGHEAPRVGEIPELPSGRTIELPGRGTTFVRELDGPPKAPTLLLLHGWTVTADLNWFTSYRDLSRRFRVIALDHRGHGRGLRSAEPFTLEDCADDAAALVDVLGLEHVIAVGYSMGGPVAQLLWRRHRMIVDGLVLCATAATFNSTRQENLEFFSLSRLAQLARLAPEQLRARVAEQFIARRGRRYETWALDQIRRNDLPTILEAGAALGSFDSRGWIGDVDVPTAVLLTMTDLSVSLDRQIRLAESIDGVKVYRVEAGHDAVYSAAAAFVPQLMAACTHVAEKRRQANQ